MTAAPDPARDRAAEAPVFFVIASVRLPQWVAEGRALPLDDYFTTYAQAAAELADDPLNWASDAVVFSVRPVSVVAAVAAELAKPDPALLDDLAESVDMFLDRDDTVTARRVAESLLANGWVKASPDPAEPADVVWHSATRRTEPRPEWSDDGGTTWHDQQTIPAPRGNGSVQYRLACAAYVAYLPAGFSIAPASPDPAEAMAVLTELVAERDNPNQPPRGERLTELYATWDRARALVEGEAGE